MSEKIVTIIHGTWARGAKWTRQGSLVDAIMSKFPGVIIHRFEWSGENKHSHRQAAMEDLRSHISRVGATNPSAEHYLVAHSHGGNVALYALKDDACKHAIRGVICLSTPFLLIRKLPYADNRLAYGPVAVFVLLYLTGSLLLMQCLAIFARSEAASIAVLVALAALGIYKAIRSLRNVLPKRTMKELLGEENIAVNISRLIEADYALPCMDPDKLLVVRTAGDEAANWLGAAALLDTGFRKAEAPALALCHEALEGLKGKDSSFGRFLDKWGYWLRLCITLGLMNLLLANGMFPVGVPNIWMSFATVVLAAAITALAIPPDPIRSSILYLGGLLFLLWLGFVRLVSAAVFLNYGSDGLVMGLFCIGTAEPAPVGNCRVSFAKGCLRSGLQHSQSYIDEEAIAASIGFIDDCGKSVRAGPLSGAPTTSGGGAQSSHQPSEPAPSAKTSKPPSHNSEKSNPT